MTEDEAKTKMCCGPQVVAMTIIVVMGDPNKVEMTPDAGRCIGSACMAWRWRFNQTNRNQSVGMWPQPDPTYERTEQGYCGLAGGSL